MPTVLMALFLLPQDITVWKCRNAVVGMRCVTGGTVVTRNDKREIYCRRTESRESTYKFGTEAYAAVWHKNCVTAEIKLYRTFFGLSLKYSRRKFHGFQHLYFKTASNSVTLNVANVYASSQWVRNTASHSTDTLFESQISWLWLFHLSLSVTS